MTQSLDIYKYYFLDNSAMDLLVKITISGLDRIRNILHPLSLNFAWDYTKAQECVIQIMPLKS